MGICQGLVRHTWADTDTNDDRANKGIVVPLMIIVCLIIPVVYITGFDSPTRSNSIGFYLCWGSAFCCLLFIFFTKKLPMWLVGIVCNIIIFGDILTDLSSAANMEQFRPWTIIILFMDLFLAIGVPSVYQMVALGMTTAWLVIFNLEASFRLGLYDIEDFSEATGAGRDLYNCADPPCATGPTGLAYIFVVAFVLHGDYFATRRFANGLRARDEEMSVTIELAQRIAVCLSRYQTEEGHSIVVASEGSMPQELRQAFLALLANLDMYKPFLPQAVLPFASDSEDEVEQDMQRSVDGPPTDLQLDGLFYPAQTTTFSHPAGSSGSILVSPAVKDGSLFSSESSGSAQAGKVSSPRRLSSGRGGSAVALLPGCMQLNVGRRHAMATLLSARVQVPFSSDFDRNTVAPVGHFATVLVNAVTTRKGVLVCMSTGDGNCSAVVSWNAHRRCATHARTACEAAIHTANTIDPARINAQWGLAVVGGPVTSANIGGESFRTPVVFGTPVRDGALLAAACTQLGLTAACDERIFAKVRTDIPARVVDVIANEDREMLVYELLQSWDGVSSEQYLRAFGRMRQGSFAEARDAFAEVVSCQSRPDTQTRRLLAVSAMLASADSRPAEYVRHAHSTTVQDLEKQAADAIAEPGRIPATVRKLLQNPAADERDEHSGVDALALTQRQQPLVASFNAEATEATPPRPGGEADGQLLQVQLDTLMQLHDQGGAERVQGGLPTSFSDARGRRYHRSSTMLGKGAFGEVWLGMADDGSMVAVKSLMLPGLEVVSPTPSGGQEQGKSGGGADETWATVELTDSLMHATGERGSHSPTGSSGNIQQSTAAAKVKIREMVSEITLMTTLHDENVVQYLGCAVEGVHILIVMEYIPGGSLQGIARQFGGTVPAGAVPRFVTDIARGLHFIHGKGIVHRDLKPANVLVTVDGQARLADFGASAELAAAAQQGEHNVLASQALHPSDLPASQPTATFSLIGTPLYMAPEQARGRAVTCSDIWALGVVLCELLSGRPPWPEAELREPITFVYKLAMNTTFAPQLDECAAMPTQARALAELCFAREPSERPTARQVLIHPYLLSQ